VSELRFAVLGPVRAWWGDTELDLGAPQQRAVLAVLLLADGRQVSLGALVDALWGPEPPKAAMGTVRTYVSRLRRRLAVGAADGAQGLIESAGDGYVLHLRPAALDLNLFLRWTAQAREARGAGDLAQAAVFLRDALALWTGATLAGLPGEYAEAQRARLAELQMAAVEERLVLDIELGGHVAAAAELRTLLTAHPLRERLSELLMLALYRAGRQADALTVFGNARRTLDEELGIDPGPALQHLHQRILQADEGLIGATGPQFPATPQSPATESRPPLSPLVRPALLPPDLPAFTGRRAELAQLSSLLDPGAPSRPAVVVGAIDGMAGIGKTALAVHWAYQVADHFPDGQLYVNLRGFDPSGSVLAPGEALRSFLDALGVAPQRIPHSLEAQAGLYRSLLRGRRVLVLLDNARDVEQVRPLLPASPGCLVIVTSRHQLTGLITTHDARALTIDGFSPDEARDALARRLGHGRLGADPAALDEVIELCAGLPLATALIAARVAAYRDLPLAAIVSELRDERTRLDVLSAADTVTDVRTVFSWSYRLLSPPAGRLFRMLSVHGGPEFSPYAAGSLAGLPETEIHPLLAELTCARLITEYRPGRFTSHDLIRVYAAELSVAVDTARDREMALDRILDHYLHTAHAARVLLRPDFVPPSPTAARLGVTREELSNYGQATAWFAAERQVLIAAVSKARDTGHHAHAWKLALTLSQFFKRQGYCHDWAATMHTALGAALAADDRAAEAHVRRSLADAYHFLGRDDEALAELERTRELFAELGYVTEHAYLHSNFGTVLTSQGHYDEAINHYRQAQDLYRIIRHEKGQAAALEGTGRCHGLQGRYAEAVAFVEKAMVLYRLLDDRNGESNCWARLGEFRHQLGLYPEARDCQRRALALCRELGNRADEAEVLASAGDSAFADGDLTEARDAWDNALVILDELQLPRADSVRDRLERLSTHSPRPMASVATKPRTLAVAAVTHRSSHACDGAMTANRGQLIRWGNDQHWLVRSTSEQGTAAARLRGLRHPTD
jgi:DNA-binding SARP family transcriptional activator/tetratricopeptide (TPR) repeat protein